MKVYSVTVKYPVGGPVSKHVLANNPDHARKIIRDASPLIPPVKIVVHR